jgi:hypothetical protein
MRELFINYNRVASKEMPLAYLRLFFARLGSFQIQVNR